MHIEYERVDTLAQHPSGKIIPVISSIENP
jgi:hypothetical protein